jgi:hypothetical protein
MNKFLLGILQVASYLMDNLRILEGWKGLKRCMCRVICRLSESLYSCAYWKDDPLKNICNSPQYVTLQKYFSHHKFSYLLFSNTTHKTKLKLQICGRLLIANHLDQSNYVANHHHQVLRFAMPCPSLHTCLKNAFCWARLICFDFSSSNVQGHILSPSGIPS